MGLSFKPETPDGKSLSYSDFIDIKSLSFINSESLIKSIVNYSANKLKKPKPIEVIADKYNEVKNNAPYDRLQLCNGHDITFIIQLSLKRKLGNYNANEYSQKRIELDLIFAYDSQDFLTTKLYNNIKKWETDNAKIVLKI